MVLGNGTNKKLCQLIIDTSGSVDSPRSAAIRRLSFNSLFVCSHRISIPLLVAQYYLISFHSIPHKLPTKVFCFAVAEGFFSFASGILLKDAGDRGFLFPLSSRIGLCSSKASCSGFPSVGGHVSDPVSFGSTRFCLYLYLVRALN